MKKLIKTACLALALMLICLTLCSCNALDEARDTHAYYKGEDIIFRGDLYKKLPSSYEPIDTIVSYNYGYYVTEKDVPVLLKSFGEEFSLYNGVISVYNYDELYDNSSYSHYCREDLYDYFCDTISTSNYNFICYEYLDEDIYEYETSLVDEPVASAIRNTLSILESAEPIGMTGTYMGTVDSMFLNSFYYCDHNMMVHSKAFEMLIEYGDNADNNKYRIKYNGYVYAIPEEYEQTLSDFMNSIQ